MSYVTVAGNEYLGIVQSKTLAVNKVTTSWNLTLFIQIISLLCGNLYILNQINVIPLKCQALGLFLVFLAFL